MGLEYGVKALTDTPSREEQKTAKETLPLEAQVRRTWTHGFHVRGDLLLSFLLSSLYSHYQRA
jgi:hypothetical protein